MNSYRILNLTHPSPDVCEIVLGATWAQKTITPSFALVCAGLTWAGFNQFLYIYHSSAGATGQDILTHLAHFLLPVFIAMADGGLAVLTLFFLYGAITGFNQIWLHVTPEQLTQSSWPLPQWLSVRQVSLRQARATVQRHERRTTSARLRYAYHLVIVEPDGRVVLLGKWLGDDAVPVRVAQAINQVIASAKTA